MGGRGVGEKVEGLAYLSRLPLSGGGVRGDWQLFAYIGDTGNEPVPLGTTQERPKASACLRRGASFESFYPRDTLFDIVFVCPPSPRKPSGG